MSGSTTPERLAAAWRTAADGSTTQAAHARPIAIGWATVELDRAVSELADALGLGNGEAVFRVAPRSVALGAACRIAPGVLPDGGSLVVLEPDTEGRLARALARLDEGPVAAWLTTKVAASALKALHAAGFTVAPERDGPFGLERLIVGGVAGGQQLLLVGREAGTIRQ